MMAAATPPAVAPPQRLAESAGLNTTDETVFGSRCFDPKARAAVDRWHTSPSAKALIRVGEVEVAAKERIDLAVQPRTRSERGSAKDRWGGDFACRNRDAFKSH